MGNMQQREKNSVKLEFINNNENLINFVETIIYRQIGMRK